MPATISNPNNGGVRIAGPLRCFEFADFIREKRSRGTARVFDS